MATPGHDTEDERLSLDMLTIAATHANTAEGMLEQADAAPKGGNFASVLQRQATIESECADRAYLLANGLASNKVYIVEEADLVHELAKRLATSENTARAARGEEQIDWERYISTSQVFLRRLKDVGVLR